MTNACTLLRQQALCLTLSIAACAAQSTALGTVRGVLPVGSRIEFLPPGSPDRKIAQAGDKGQYSLQLDPARYEITLVLATGKKFSGSAWLGQPGSEIQINAESRTAATGLDASAQAYDLLADWRVLDGTGKAVGAAKLTIEAELNSGRLEKLPAWALVGVGDEEKETEGPLETTPDGRSLFRIREARLRPDRIVALRVSVNARGFPALTKRITPAFEFSASGHFHAIYPDDLTMTLGQKP